MRTVEEVTIKFAGDSGDGMQLIGELFTNNTALTGSDLATFPDFPAEIRAPQGTIPGVSGFQLHFGSKEIYTPGDDFDVLVAMNAAALITNIGRLKKDGIIVANTDGFDGKNLRLAHLDENQNPLESTLVAGYELIKIPITRITKEALVNSPVSTRDKERCKNMFVLGLLLWKYNRSLESVSQFFHQKFKTQPDILQANLTALRSGYHFGETTETFSNRYHVEPAPLPKGLYRNIIGNQALVLGLIAASQKSGLPLFYGSYPITPASDVLHSLAKYKNFGVKTFQAEDEIAAICSAIGASYGGNLAITGTSGPGLALKTEALGFAVMLEQPLVVVDIQRGGPSTGLPTKTEQSDLLQAVYGRNGECPVPVLAACSPADCFEMAFEACRIALQHMTPVILLSDGYIANGAEPWRIPKSADLPGIKVQFAPPRQEGDDPFWPYLRDEKLVRNWAIPGTQGLRHRIGGLEKQALTGNVSYDPANHEFMVKTREAKVEKIADYLPELNLEEGPDKGDVLLLGWGSTFGVMKSVTRKLRAKGMEVSHAHLRYIRPLPKNLEHLLRQFKKILIPEINNGQLSKIIRDRYLIQIFQYNKIQGSPITEAELEKAVMEVRGGV